ncbi:MAG: type II toxin-antitoxin system HicB family antitoxin [Reyranella sp.]|uniref:type II toxin-antitoxin system HicB family antitoxin n=1 Tax=Reyranella sp. TaxID=1929291 RepID=UPI003D0CDB1E
MVDACYYSLIERADDGRFVGWIPDLPGVTAAGYTEDETLRALSRNTRLHLGKLVQSGQPLPTPRPADELPCSRGRRILRRLLLIVG